jgi:NADPH:quinone reductase-like Zn-dependent oxidoreductase
MSMSDALVGAGHHSSSSRPAVYNEPTDAGPVPFFMRAVDVRTSKSLAALSAHVHSDVPVPQWGPGQLLVRIHSVALTAADAAFCRGEGTALHWGERRRPGFSFAGTVAIAGDRCSRLRAGDKVYGSVGWSHTGTLSEYAAVDERLAACMPLYRSFAECAALARPGFCANELQPLFPHAAPVVVLNADTAAGQDLIQYAQTVSAGFILAATDGLPASALTLEQTTKADVIATSETVWDLVAAREDKPAVVCVVGETIAPRTWRQILAHLRPGGAVVHVDPGCDPATHRFRLPHLLRAGFDYVSKASSLFLRCGRAAYHRCNQMESADAALRDLQTSGTVPRVHSVVAPADFAAALATMAGLGPADGRVLLSW